MDRFLIAFIILVWYIALLFVCRYLEIGAKKKSLAWSNCCPDCSLALNRIKRLYKDKIVYNITFRVFEYKRYRCNDCGWEGLRWSKKYKSGKSQKGN